jgi:hypothetical protein
MPNLNLIFQRTLITLLAFLATISLLFAIFYHSSTVRVNVINNSDGEISNIVIVGTEDSVTIQSIEKNKSKKIKLKMHGEGTYSIRATLSSGITITGDGRYIESGYKVQDTVTSKGIEHEFGLFY